MRNKKNHHQILLLSRALLIAEEIQASLSQFLEYLYHFQFLCEHVVHVPVKEYKLKLNRLSDPGSENGKLENIINIDGEVCHLKTPEVYCR